MEFVQAATVSLHRGNPAIDKFSGLAISARTWISLYLRVFYARDYPYEKGHGLPFCVETSLLGGWSAKLSAAALTISAWETFGFSVINVFIPEEFRQR